MEIQVSERPETTTRSGVVCIFCGLPTPVQTSRKGALAVAQGPRTNRMSIVRCEVCGKEAPYGAHEVSEFGEMFHEPSASLWFAKDSI